MKQARFYIIVSVTAIIVLTIMRVVVTNTISTGGIGLGKIQQEIADYKKENTLLHQKILELSSLTNIASQAGELGFVPSKNEVVLTDQPPLALKQ